MVFRKRGAKTYQTKALGVVLSTGTRDAHDADDIERTLLGFAGRRGQRFARPDVVQALLAKRVSVADVYDAHLAGTLDLLMAEVARKQADADDTDLSPLVAEWEAQGASPRYVRQVRRLIAEGKRFPVSEFRRKRLGTFLRTLPVDEPTKKTYKSALSQFAVWLIEQEVLDANPLRDVGTFSPNDPKVVWLERVQARAIVDALAGEARAVAALMFGAGIEWQAAARVTRRGVDLTARTVFADGGKTKWRRRVVTVTEPWAWDVVEPVFRAMTPGARLTTLRHKAFWSQFRDACVAAGGPVIAPHDARHCYAVWNLKGGMDRQQLRRQLGHSPHSILIFTTYGVWIPEVAAEYAGGASVAAGAAQAVAK